MSREYPHDPLLKALASLPAVAPDPVASEAIRSRCRAELEGQGTHALPLEPAAAGLAGAYAWQLLKLALLLSH